MRRDVVTPSWPRFNLKERWRHTPESLFIETTRQWNNIGCMRRTWRSCRDNNFSIFYATRSDVLGQWPSAPARQSVTYLRLLANPDFHQNIIYPTFFGVAMVAGGNVRRAPKREWLRWQVIGQEHACRSFAGRRRNCRRRRGFPIRM